MALVVVGGCGGGDAGASGPTGPDDGGVGSDTSTGSGDGGIPDGGSMGSEDGSTESDAGPQPLGPPYPIVLAHGFFGFADLVGIVEYWYEIPAELERAGETQVFVTEVDPFNGSDVRGAELITQIEMILATTGHDKVNLIGHSQGGLDARVVAHERPDLVASATTLATPHQGSEIADLVESLPDSVLEDLLPVLTDFLGIVYDQDTAKSDVLAALDLFSEDGIAAFNATYTDSPGVPYYSITGRSDWTWATEECDAADRPSFITKWDDERDPIDPLLSFMEGTLDDGDPIWDWGNIHPNDGLVRVESGKWGRFLGCIPADHLDEVGQLFGDSPDAGSLRTNDFDYLEFYVDLIEWLRAQGH
ncbi:MAG: esterase/lipase family protein [Myxococcota bacterium]